MNRIAVFFCKLFICAVLFQLSPGDIAIVKKMYKCDGNEEGPNKNNDTIKEGEESKGPNKYNNTIKEGEDSEWPKKYNNTIKEGEERKGPKKYAG